MRPYNSVINIRRSSHCGWTRTVAVPRAEMRKERKEVTEAVAASLVRQAVAHRAVKSSYWEKQTY